MPLRVGWPGFLRLPAIEITQLFHCTNCEIDSGLLRLRPQVSREDQLAAKRRTVGVATGVCGGASMLGSREFALPQRP